MIIYCCDWFSRELDGQQLIKKRTVELPGREELRVRIWHGKDLGRQGGSWAYKMKDMEKATGQSVD